jgi:hypothetical protein
MASLILALLSAAPAPKELNNFVTELLCVSPKRGGTLEFEFANPRDGWILLRSTVEGGKAEIWLDGERIIAYSDEMPSTQDAFRLLSGGIHGLKVVCGAGSKLGQLIVRAIPEILYAKFGYDPWIRPFGPYDRPFLERYVFPYVTTIIGTGAEAQKPFVAQWKATGRRWLVECGVPGLEARGEKPTISCEEAYKYWAQSPGFRDPELDGVIVDEFLDGRANYPAWTEAIRKLATDFPGKLFFPYLGTSGRWFYTTEAGREFVEAVIKQGFKLAWERYIPEQATEEEAESAIRRSLGDAVAAWAEAVPGFQKHLIVCLGVFSCFPLSLSHFPNVDFKVFLDMQLNHLANDPVFKGVYGIMGWTSGYMDEETVRWLGLLYRHYCLEGRTDLLSKRFGFRYRTDFIYNPDFELGLEGWEARPAEEGSVKPGKIGGYGWIQGRWPKVDRGDSFLLLKRSDKAPNIVWQEIKGLEPDRLYSLKFVTSDYQAVLGKGEDKEPHAISVRIEGAEVLKSFRAITSTRTVQGHSLNFHWFLFRPKGDVAKLVISDWKSEEEAGGPIGQELALNFVEIQPYLTAVCAAQPLRLYVAPDGNDAWSGRLPAPNVNRTDGPFATIERARDAIRELKRQGLFPKGGVIVELQSGVYELTRPLELNEEDSGLPDAPIVYRACEGGKARLMGGKRVTGWRKVADTSVLSRLEEDVRDKIWQADLKALGIVEFGSPAGGGLELFFNDMPMTLARYPNEGFMHIADIVEYDGHQIHGIKGSRVGRFYYEGDRPKRWIGEKDAWLHGYWFWDWSDQRHRLKSIDPEKRIMEVEPPYHHYGYRKGQWFYAYNILAELDSPGEWYLDRATGMLYFYPPSDINEGEAIVSALPTLLTIRGASHVLWEGIVMEAVRGTVVTITGGTGVRIAGCVIRNGGGYAVRIEGGANHAVISCDIYGMGEGGIAMNGGDREKLTPSLHLAENNHIHHYARWHRMYRPAIALNGVGNKARHNFIHDAPHQAIAFSGNDHLMEFNRIERVCLESNDAGAIYSGRDWTWRGTVIRFNLFCDIKGFQGKGAVGVYLDDMLCGTVVFGNVFVRVTNAAFIGGGRDNIVENNIFVDCEPAVHVDARAMGWASSTVDTTMKERLMEVPYKQSPWKERYPQLVGILEDEPAAPKGNIIVHNICMGGRWMDVEEKAKPYIRVEENLIGSGFQPIPIEQIGLYRDKWRRL